MTVHKLRSPDPIDPTGQRSFPNIAIETKMLVDMALERRQSGGITITYDEMKDLIGREVTPHAGGYTYLASARRILLRDHGIVFDSEPKVGVRICSNEEKMVVSGRDLKRARRAVVRSRQKLVSVEYERLPPDKKKEWNARMSIIGALDLMTAPNSVKKIERAVSEQILPSAATLALFKG